MPLLISLDPARRGEWETALAKQVEETATSTSADIPAVAPVISADTELPENSSAQTASAQPATSAKGIASTQPDSTVAADQTISSPSTVVEHAPVPLKADLPPAQEGETYSSTSYKARLFTEHIVEQLERHRKEGQKGPLMVGLQGPQGCGECVHEP